jgi:hypothetical protein
MVVGAFLDITVDGWRKWIIATTDAGIPDDLHTHVANIIMGLSQTDGATYQDYLQALCLLSDGSLLWLVRHAGNSPL